MTDKRLSQKAEEMKQMPREKAPEEAKAEKKDDAIPDMIGHPKSGVERPAEKASKNPVLPVKKRKAG